MLFLNASTIQELYTMQDCIEDVEKAFRYGHEGKTVAPIRVSVPHTKLEAETLYMPSYIEPENYTAVKIVSIFPHNASEGRSVLQGIILLTDALTGEHVAVMDASFLTVLRTGASSGVATKYLAKKNAASCAILGCGAQAVGQLEAVMAVRNIEKVLLYNRTIEKAHQFKEKLQKTWSGEISVISDANEAVRAADIIVCSTKSSTPIFDGNVLTPGAHINGIGSYQAHMQEVDVETLRKSNRIVVDTLEGVMHEAGDFLVPMEQDLFSKESIYGEIGEIICGEKEGRQREEEITFYKSVGTGFLDTMVASSVYRKALEQKKGIKVDW